MNFNAFSRINRRRFVVGAAGVAATAIPAARALAQSTPIPEASPSTGEEGPLIRIEFVGGFRPMEFYLMRSPNLLVYADGSVIQPAPVIAIYPPVAITPFNVFKIRESILSDLMKRAAAAGLNEERQISNTQLMDAPTARITVRFDDRTVVSNIYGLDMTDSIPSDWDEETAGHFHAIQEFASYARNMVIKLDPDDMLMPESPYTPEHLELFAFLPDEANPLPSGVPDLSAAPLIWPLEDSLADIGAVYDVTGLFDLSEMRCADVRGADAAKVVETAATGNFVSPWSNDGELYGLLINPLFPGDSSCRTSLM
jgi:hypothetical protein